MFKKLFSKAGKEERSNKFSVYDIMINILPMCVITTALFLLNIILLALCPLFGADAGVVWRNWAIYTGIGVAIGYVIMALSAIIIMIVERNRIKNVSFWKKVAVVVTWPIFTILAVPIELVALFSKNLTWKAIPHTDNTNFEKLNTEHYQTEEEKLEG